MPEGLTEDKYRKYILPALAVLETMATKGKSPGTTAMMQEQRFSQREQEAATAEERARKAAMEQELFGFRKSEFAAGEQTRTAKALQQKQLAATRAAYERALDMAATPEEKRQVVLDFLAKKAPAKFEAATRPKEAKPSFAEELAQALAKQKAMAGAKAQAVTKLPAGQAKDFGDKRASVKMLDNMMGKAKDLDLWFMPGDIVRALNPWDTEAKAFQQLVATTKQVIGKGLEGGVLRKEDENKYEKIIPRLGDTWDVLTKKANQLKEMLITNYNEAVGAYDDAGYKVDRFPMMDFELYSTQPKTPPQPRAAAGPAPAQVAQTQAFNTVQEAEAANLPPGTRITIGGRAAVVE